MGEAGSLNTLKHIESLDPQGLMNMLRFSLVRSFPRCLIAPALLRGPVLLTLHTMRLLPLVLPAQMTNWPLVSSACSAWVASISGMVHAKPSTQVAMSVQRSSWRMAGAHSGSLDVLGLDRQAASGAHKHKCGVV